MKTEETLSKGIIKRIVFITLVLVVLLGIGVLAGTQSVNSVTIKFLLYKLKKFWYYNQQLMVVAVGATRRKFRGSLFLRE